MWPDNFGHECHQFGVCGRLLGDGASHPASVAKPVLSSIPRLDALFQAPEFREKIRDYLGRLDEQARMIPHGAAKSLSMLSQSAGRFCSAST